MEKIYGYKRDMLEKLIKYVERHNGEKKVDVFNAFAKKYKRKSGSVRNMYYALAKRNCFANSVKKIIAVDKGTEDKIICHVLVSKSKGVSVRRGLMELANGDMKLYLRFQNKYRAILKKDKKRIDDALLLLKATGKIDEKYWATEEVKKRVSPFVFDKLSKEIDNLLFRYNLNFASNDGKLKESAVVFYKKIQALTGEIKENNGEEFFKAFIELQTDGVS